MKCGVYKIINKIDNKFYIGSSIDIEQRWYKHKSLLRNNKHPNKHLQNAWNKYGEICFEFQIICLTEKEKLLLIEQKFIIQTNCCNNKIGYNISYNTISPNLGKKLSLQEKQKISDSMKGKKHSQETKDKIGRANKNKKRTQEQKDCLSKIKKHNPSGAAVKGHKKTEEHKNKIKNFAKTRIGTKNANSKLTSEQIQQILTDFNDKEISLTQIAKKYNVSLSTIKRIKYNISGYTKENINEPV
jgi:hypothetical protein